ncbi:MULTISPECIES: GNAT family N-acetyltransferase [unclassified Pseudomonas]|uniref:GNAT family N-acetyltransferase n=1 Tax=unclassified Pseudomonas TaxID=196821 RepID=UPI0025E70F25|nr:MULTISPECIES: GNAT family N-acetyltransferase [unclassified Pseudomonas]
MHIPSHAIQITDVQPADIPEVVGFVMQARKAMFPMLDPAALPDDLRHFQRTYLESEGGRFFIARLAGKLIGAVGYLPYDGRFAHLHFGARHVVEVVRLFVDPGVRRLGLAARLVALLKAAALSERVKVLYLHTHPFLPGAIAFWQRQGFDIVNTEDDPVWQTTHMQCLL